MGLIKELPKWEFEKRFPEVYISHTDMPVYLENGVVLLGSEWNGEEYIIKTPEGEKCYRPVTKPDGDDYEVIGYEECF